MAFFSWDPPPRHDRPNQESLEVDGMMLRGRLLLLLVLLLLPHHDQVADWDSGTMHASCSKTIDRTSSQDNVPCRLLCNERFVRRLLAKAMTMIVVSTTYHYKREGQYRRDDQ